MSNVHMIEDSYEKALLGTGPTLTQLILLNHTAWLDELIAPSPKPTWAGLVPLWQSLHVDTVDVGIATERKVLCTIVGID